MQPEAAGPILANMSAPPRSTVMLPRLALRTAAPAAPAAAPGGAAGGSATAGAARGRTLRDVAVGAGGGSLLSHALCVAFVYLPTAVGAHLGMSCRAPILIAPLGLARALVAIARHSGGADGRPASAHGRAARLELDRVAPLPQGALVDELLRRLESTAWPHWVPRVACAIALGADIAAGVDQGRPPAPPTGVGCPLLAARLVAAIRGPVFMRDAPPALSNLLHLCRGRTPAGIWEIWLPVRPGQVRPLRPTDPSATEHDA
jgi:hypothetical protein